MLKAFTTQDEVPEALREHYLKGTDGKWHAEIPTDHPAIKNNATLLNDKHAAETKLAQAESDLEHAKSSGVPRGHKAVPNAEVELLNEIKALGSPAEIKTKLTEHASLKTESDKRKREDSLRAVAKVLEFDNADAFVRLAGLPEFEIREKDGKKTVIAKVKEGDNFVEKPAQEFIESSVDIAPFLSALKTKNEGTTVHGTSGASGTPGQDPFKWAREFGEDWNKSRPSTDVAAAFGITKSA